MNGLIESILAINGKESKTFCRLLPVLPPTQLSKFEPNPLT